jgi:MFS family permease
MPLGEVVPPTPGRRRLALAVLCAAFFIEVLGSTSTFAALPAIGRSLDIGPTVLAAAVAVYGVVIAGLMLPFGRVADALGRRRVFLAGVIAFGVGSLACGLAPSGAALIAARGLQGLGAAALTPAALALLLSIHPAGPERNRALGIWGGLGGIGATAGLLLGGLVTDTLGWPWIFFLNVPVCVAVLVFTRRAVPESRQARRRPFDVAGGLLLAAALMLLVVTLLAVPSAGWSLPVWIGLAGVLCVSGALILVERRSADPVLPARLFRSRSTLAGNGVVLASGIAVDGLLTLATLYAQRVLGLSALVFGMALAVMTITSVAAVWLGQRWVTHRGVRPVAVSGSLLLSAACVAFAVIPGGQGTLPVLLAGLLVFGCGMGAAFVAGQIAAVMGAQPDDVGAASGLEETVFTVGGTMGVALVASISLSFAKGGAAQAEVALAGLHAGFAALVAVTAAGAVTALLLPRPGRSDGTPSRRAEG